MKLPFGKKTATPNDAATEEPKPPGFWKSIDWKLMLALLFPVTLETLDYTVVATAQSHIAVSILAPFVQTNPTSNLLVRI
ncbi:hypothetical protein SCLCIDRAFT_1213142 [Scleroderma citrinum Foug A]|uniref:Uncharacterized protein n=1 Tax=Scleroderma citrinum Foug A TaxID=1036808 RepID=A0A0C3E8E1_9AGAM|nr:hypothetical protein SCLCIDRAFT_1213142 [Scleroderma citrinum Foug A]